MGNQEKPNTVQIIPLGGVGEVGKNMTVIRYNHQMIVVDAGLTMPEDEMLGIDTVIPDISFLRENKHQLMGIVLTHGHEDHIGALPYILDELNVPTYGTRLTVGLVKRKLRERRLARKPKLHVIDPRGEIKIGPFKIEFIRVSHSIPDAVALAIHTPVGVIVHTGDFKIDLTPIDGQVTDFYKFASLGEKGVLALMSDSTNAEKKGYTKSEKIVGKNIEAVFQEKKGRIIIASFASNVHRLQQIIDAAKICKRKVAVMGRSMVNMVEVSQQLGYLKIPKGLLMDIDEVLRLPKEKVCVISTGSQGEPMSALSRIAAKGHRKIEIINDDTVIISAMAIPGNEKYVSKLIDHLQKLGANVVYGKAVDIHVSGHASEEDLKLILTLVKPKYFIPVHGEYRMQMAHRALAIDVGVKKENIFVPENGNVIALSKQSGGIVNRVHAGAVLVDGLGVGDVSNIVLRDRKILSENGIIIAVISMDKKGQIVAGPDIVSRGFVYVRQSEELLDEIKEKSRKIIDQLKKEKVKDWSTIKTRMRNELDSFVYGKIKRNPMVIPMIIEV